MVVSLDKHAPTIKPLGNYNQGPMIERNHYSNPSGHGYYHHYYSHGNKEGGSYKEAGAKKSVALTALTLLAFLFFLNILQNCLHEQVGMNQNNGQQVLVLSRLKTHREADKRKDEYDGNVAADMADAEDISAEETAQEDDEKTYLQIAKRVLDTGYTENTVVETTTPDMMQDENKNKY